MCVPLYVGRDLGSVLCQLCYAFYAKPSFMNCTCTLCYQLLCYRRNLLVCGTMDRKSHLIDIENNDQPILQSFDNHTK